MDFIDNNNGTWDTVLTAGEVQVISNSASSFVDIQFALGFFTFKFDTTRLGDLVPYLDDLAQRIHGAKFKQNILVLQSSRVEPGKVVFTGEVELGDFFWLIDAFKTNVSPNVGKKELTKFMNDFLQVSGTKAVVEPRYY